MQFVCRAFDEFSPRELYAVLRLRAEVFVVEQDCVYLDPDEVDFRAQHLLGLVDGELRAYLRWYDHDRGTKVGRIVTSPRARGRGLGHAIVAEAVSRLGAVPLVMDAQSHLAGFYGAHGFVIEGEPFLEDGIPHVFMVREPRR